MRDEAGELNVELLMPLIYINNQWDSNSINPSKYILSDCKNGILKIPRDFKKQFLKKFKIFDALNLSFG